MSRVLGAITLAILLSACELLGAPATARPTATRTATPTATSSPTPAPSATPTPSPTPSPTLSPAPTGYTSPRGTITVDQPRAFARATSPLAVSGAASLFEASFSWRVVDLAGKELASGNGQASAGAPERGTFSFSAAFTVTTDTYGYVEVTSHSAKDGSVDDMARVPLVLGTR